MCIEPIELWLDLRALRRGLIYPVDPDIDPTALRVQDSGMVPVNTQIAIVNPETCTLCRVGEYGEIWVQSDACAKAFYGSKQEFDIERFNGRVVDGDTSVQYVRTGDLGFLHTVTRPIGPGGQPVEMQVLFVLSGIGETFEINGLNHFPVDIEASVEKCHRNIVPGGWSVSSIIILNQFLVADLIHSAVFQAGGLVVVLVEITRKSYLASIVPVIVNAILNEHQVVADIVAFVSHGDFPRSRLGEKQRGKILGSWVTRKMRTMAQFSIRDADGTDGNIGDPQSRINRGSKTGSVMGSSLRHSTVVPDNESSSRAPAPVQEEKGHELIDEPYRMQEDEDERPYQDMLNDPAYELADDAAGLDLRHDENMNSSQFSVSPMHIVNPEDNGAGPTPVVSPHDGFDFGTGFPTQFDSEDYGLYRARSAAIPSFELVPPTRGSQGTGSSLSTEAPAPLQVQNKGRESLPSQQQRYSSLPSGVDSLRLSDDHFGNGDSQSWLDSNQEGSEAWPQEALLYGSRLNTPGANGNVDADRASGAHGRQRFD